MTRVVEAAPSAPERSRPGRTVVLDGSGLTLDDVTAVARDGARVVLSDDPRVRAPMAASRALRDDALRRGIPIYGVTTGFGDSVHRQIAPGKARELQAHLVRNLGCGTGALAPVDVARATVLIRANSLARGHSGVRVELVERLLDLLNAGIVPLIPEEGSVGASGDLVPLSYVAAVVTGTRDVLFRGEVRPAAEAFRQVGLDPLVLEPKEALSLVNGTAFMTAFAALAVTDARRVARAADTCTALAVEVLNGIAGPFTAFIHDVAKPHPGQVRSAANIRRMLEGSGLARGYDEVVDEAGALDGGGYRELTVHIQDRYSLRCAPHFVGVLWDTLEWVERWLTTEINSTNDNPLFDVDTGGIRSGGNFSGGHVALAMDALRTAVASVADLLDRQLELVVDEKFNNELTPNLIARLPAGHAEEGLNHGFKGMQLACSSLTADALSRCMPTTVFSRSTECHNQDKVSMGTTAARHTRDVVALTEKVAAIHLLALCQAADLRGADRLGRTRAVFDRIRARVPFVGVDREMAADIAQVVELLHDDSLTETFDRLAG
ncbi:MAG TPA: aromatic amino acid ammonia-lyase [Acidimicrobiia bacterium]|nr:aromatic amino acid ammonia-lyase [Acidimicrobiia bacterium]